LQFNEMCDKTDHYSVAILLYPGLEMATSDSANSGGHNWGQLWSY